MAQTSACIEARHAAGSSTKDYACIMINGKRYLVHRLVACIFLGLDLKDTTTHVCHRCDNPRCINPDHLFLGTAGDNVRDCIAKGRFVFNVAPQNGAANGMAKLTEEQVLEIRAAPRSVKTRILAEKYGLNYSTVSRIRRGQGWKNLIPNNQPKEQ